MPDRPLRLEGPGFVLRPRRSDDLEALLRHANDEAVSRGLRDRFPFPYTRDDGEAFLGGRIPPRKRSTRHRDRRRRLRQHRRPTGVAERGHTAELGYWLGRAYWGQGWMTRVVGLFAPSVMDELHLFRLQAEVLDFNEGSARVLLGNGFTEEGTARAAVFKRGQLHDLRRFAKVRTLNRPYRVGAR